MKTKTNTHSERAPDWRWNLTAVIGGIGTITAFWFAVVDDDSKSAIRFLVAILGWLTVWAGIKGKFGTILQKVRHQIVPIFLIVGTALVGYAMIESAVFRPTREASTQAEVHALLSKTGYALLQYAQDYDNTLPPEMTASTIKTYLRPYGVTSTPIDQFSGKPFIWRRELQGVDCKIFKNTDTVIVAYSVPYSDHNYRSVLLLTGASFRMDESEFWTLFNKQKKILRYKRNP